MFKKGIALALSAAALFTFASCGMVSSLLNGGAEDHSKYQVGQKVSTMFFDFTVLSANPVDEFAGITPGEGNQLIDVVITTTNNFGEDLEMYDTDFQLQWAGGDEAYADTFEAVDETMAPYTHVLADGETMEFHYLYEAPADIKDFQLAYLEEIAYDDGEEDTGEFFLVNFSVQPSTAV